MSEGAKGHETSTVRYIVLQWGRHQSMSEGMRARTTQPSRIAPSMGPTSVDVGRKAEDHHVAQPRHQPASMGPTSVDVGRLDLRVNEVQLLDRLQWGRHQSMSEGRLRGVRSTARARLFNGADISRCRKVDDGAGGHASRLRGFNGADISRCRKELGSRRSGLAGHDGASMGPTSVDVGRRVSRRWRTVSAVFGFNGADISRCRRGAPFLRRAVDVRLRASMGPTSVDVGGPLIRELTPALQDVALQWGRHQSMSEGANRATH